MPSGHQSVLLVDDSVDTLEMYALGLSFAGYRPLMAVDAASAIGQLEKEHPDVVVTDLQLLGGRSGWELIETIKTSTSKRNIPIVLLTGNIDDSITVNAQRVGCVAVVAKPCLPEDLVHVLQRVLPTVG